MPYITLDVPYIIDADALWSRVWGASPESAGSHFRGIAWMEGDWDKTGLVEVLLEDPEDEDKTIGKMLTITDIVAALSDAAFPHHLRQEILDDNADCISADAVIQQAVYGEIIFG